MIPIGYMAKRVHREVAWLKNSTVEDIYALSGCLSETFADYTELWLHNGYWLFDSPTLIEDIARGHRFDLANTVMFYYEVHDLQYDEATRGWGSVAPEPSLKTAVEAPRMPRLEGFDVVTCSATAGPECSPLSCNGLAETIPVNRHCLIESFDLAKAALEQGLFDNSEPGPFRIVAVYTLGQAVNPGLAPGNRLG